MNFKKYKQDLDQKRNTVQMKTNDRMLFCESLCSRLQNKKAVIHHLINKSSDNNIELEYVQLQAIAKSPEGFPLPLQLQP